MLICCSLQGWLAAYIQPTENTKKKSYGAVFVAGRFGTRASLITGPLHPGRKVFVCLSCRNEKLIK